MPSTPVHADTVTFTSDGLELVGTLEPGQRGDTDRSRPAALLIPGSGPIDRDSNSRQLRIDVTRQLAEHLAVAGVTSLRYDKRGVGASQGEYASAGLFDNVADARAALAALRRQPHVDPDRVVVVGHSEGAIIATELAAEDDGPAGAVLLAGSATTGEQVLAEQAAMVAATLPGPVRWLLRLLRQNVVASQAAKVERLRATTSDTIRMQLVKVNAKWFREFIDHDPAPSLRRIRVPVLAVVGGKDAQIHPDHARRIGELVGDDAIVEIVPDASHLLRHEPGPPSVRSYRKQVREPVLPAVLDLVTDFCLTVEARTP